MNTFVSLTLKRWWFHLSLSSPWEFWMKSIPNHKWVFGRSTKFWFFLGWLLWFYFGTLFSVTRLQGHCVPGDLDSRWACPLCAQHRAWRWVPSTGLGGVSSKHCGNSGALAALVTKAKAFVSPLGTCSPRSSWFLLHVRLCVSQRCGSFLAHHSPAPLASSAPGPSLCAGPSPHTVLK